VLLQVTELCRDGGRTPEPISKAELDQLLPCLGPLAYQQAISTTDGPLAEGVICLNFDYVSWNMYVVQAMKKKIFFCGPGAVHSKGARTAASSTPVGPALSPGSGGSIYLGGRGKGCRG
jgi:hypothetical protein